MNFFRRIFKGLRRNLKFSVSNPKNFKEVWSFNSTFLRVLSLTTLLVVVLSIPISMLLSSVFGIGGGSQEGSVEHTELVEQNKKIIDLTHKLSAQEEFIRNIGHILNGEIPVDTPLDSLGIIIEDLNLDSLDSEETNSEKELAKKVREDLTTNKTEASITLFSSPAYGVVSQKFNKPGHPGVDIVTTADYVVKACLTGTVIYSGYTRKDGYVLIIDHGGKYLSIYKHNRRALKKAGDRVKSGDPIAVVGNTGENSTGPHLHFELWLDQRPVNPEDYMSFKN